MSAPVIAMPEMGGGLFRSYMKAKYVQSLRRAGALVRWIPLADLDDAVRTALLCDGLLLPGGGDIDPALYGQTPLPACGKPHVLRDRAEPPMLRAFLETGKPVLAICRGVQLLNVALGGTLLQDITPDRQVSHRAFSSRARGTHSLQIVPGTRLRAILGSAEIIVNSMHHQAADIPGAGLRVAATAPDGVTEALELGGYPFCLGVQWHPEHMSKTHPAQQALFKAFAAACLV